MAASMETLGIGGHEYLAEKIFEKVKGLPKDLELVELTKNEYDALTPEQKADPTKLYLVPGDGKYLKFQEISAADYEALSQEEKMDPYTVYMTPGDGTYFRVIDISQEDYDALPEAEKTNPNNLYLIPGDDAEYLTKTEAEETYLGIEDAEDTYAKKTEIPDISGLETESHAEETYLSIEDAEDTYATKNEAQIVTRQTTGEASVAFNDTTGNLPFNKCLIHFKPNVYREDTEHYPSPTNTNLINGRVNVTLCNGHVLNTAIKEYYVEFNDAIIHLKDIFTFNPNTNVQFPIYEADYDPINGTLTVLKWVKYFDGTETLGLVDRSIAGQRYTEFTYLFDDDYFVHCDGINNDDPNLVSSTYRTVRDSIHQGINDYPYWCTMEASTLVIDNVEGKSAFRWRHDGILSKEDMASYFEEMYENLTPIYFIATLQEPIVLNVGRMDLRTLEGDNVLWCSLDTNVVLDVEYLTNTLSGAFTCVDNTVMVNAERPSGATDDSSLTTSISLRDMEDLIEKGYDISIKYIYEEYAGGGNLLYKETQYLRFKTYQMWTQYSAGTAQSAIYFTSNDTGYEYRIQALSGSDSTTLTKLTI